MVRVGILNVTGYGGIGAAQLVVGHPEMTLVGVTARSGAGARVSSIFPFWSGPDFVMTESLEESCDLVISALPHGTTAAIEPFVRSGCRVADLSANFRLHDPSLYAQWYGEEHTCPDLLASAVYGMPELHYPQLTNPATRLVAVPGCYPTASILALAPALAAGLIDSGIVVDAKSGISGGGRSLTLNNHFAEIDESVTAYGLTGHRHGPEIEQELAALTTQTLRLTFVPHLVPMVRGLHATCYADLKPGIDAAAVRTAYQDFYADAPWTRVTVSPPQTKWTSGTNLCLVYPTVDTRTGRLISIGCIDNLGKGAAGQAVQCANLLFGFPETMGLSDQPVYP